MYLNRPGGLRYRPRGRGSRWLWLAALLPACLLALLLVDLPPPAPPAETPAPSPTPAAPRYAAQAETLRAAGRLPEAVLAYQRAIRAEPRNAAYHASLARLLLYQGSLDLALESASTAIFLDPGNSKAHALRAAVLRAQGDAAEAERAVLQALRLDPRNALAHAYYAEMLADQRLWDQARAEAEHALTLGPDLPEAYHAYGYLLEALGDNQGAVTQYTAGLEHAPNAVFLRLAAGRVYAGKLGDPRAAVEHIARAAEVDSGNPDLLAESARLHAAVGERAKAGEAALQALQIAPHDPALHGLLGRLYYRSGEYALAAEPLQLAVEGGETGPGPVPSGVAVAPLSKEAPEAPEVYVVYGLNLLQEARCERSVPLFREVLAAWPEAAGPAREAEQGLQRCRELLAGEDP